MDGTTTSGLPHTSNTMSKLPACCCKACESVVPGPRSNGTPPNAVMRAVREGTGSEHTTWRCNQVMRPNRYLLEAKFLENGTSV